jgi:hypothetical protein
LLDHLKGCASSRKLRHFAITNAMRIWEDFPNETCRAAVAVAERFSDGLATSDELARANELVRNNERQFQFTYKNHDAWLAALCATWVEDETDLANSAAWGVATYVPKVLARTDDFRLIRASVCNTVRDIFGNPFRPIAFDPRWRTADAVGLARGIYDDRAFDRLPLLADALMDAGCADEQVVGHCRSEGPHVRGCWVVDLVIGKE